MGHAGGRSWNVSAEDRAVSARRFSVRDGRPPRVIGGRAWRGDHGGPRSSAPSFFDESTSARRSRRGGSLPLATTRSASRRKPASPRCAAPHRSTRPPIGNTGTGSPEGASGRESRLVGHRLRPAPHGRSHQSCAAGRTAEGLSRTELKRYIAREVYRLLIDNEALQPLDPSAC